MSGRGNPNIPGFQSTGRSSPAASSGTAASSQRTSQSQTFASQSSSSQTSFQTSSTARASTETTETTETRTTHSDARFTRQYAEGRLSNFRLDGGSLRMDFQNEQDKKVELTINLDEHLGFTEMNSLSWEARGFSSVTTATIRLAGSIITATYDGVESKIDLFEKLRIFNETVIVLSFQKRMYTQVPWMNFRILAVPTFTEEMEEMITTSTVRIASSTVAVATTRIRQEINRVIEETMASVHQSIMKRVTMEMACLKEAIQEEVTETIRATNRDNLQPIGWSTLETEYGRLRA